MEERKGHVKTERDTCHQPRNSWRYQMLEEAKIDSCLAENLMWDSGLQNGSGTYFWCFKPPGLWQFLSAATGK